MIKTIINYCCCDSQVTYMFKYESKLTTASVDTYHVLPTIFDISVIVAITFELIIAHLYK